jgi:hypothetical protein
MEGYRRRLVSGKIALSDGTNRRFAFAYDVRKEGVVSCDGSGDDPRGSKLLRNTTLPLPLDKSRVDDELLAELAKLPENREELAAA